MKLLYQGHYFKLVDTIRGIPDARIRIAQVSDGYPKLPKDAFARILRINPILQTFRRRVEYQLCTSDGYKLICKQVSI